jgi:two-component system, sporulation sensor kinase B
MNLLQGLLINLLFILLLILLINIITFTKPKWIKFITGKINIFFICSFGMLLSYVVSVPIGNGFIYDLRFIPFLLGGIYGGKRVVIGLAFVMVLIRLPLGGIGVFLTLIVAILAAITIMILSPKLSHKPIHMKCTWITLLAFLYSLIGFLVPSFVFGFQNFYNFLIYSSVLTCSTFFVSYLCEVLRTFNVLQRQIIRFEKMEIVSHLAASISHEVRNPLTTIKGFLQLIQEHGSIHPDCKQYSSFALEETDRATEIINQYLTFAKPHTDLEETIHLQQELQKCVDIIQPLALKQGVTIEYQTNLEHNVKGNPQKMQQVLLNICKNGIESMENGGELSITTRDKEENKVEIHIKDTGKGMTREQVARLGEPYFSLKDNNGTGLGMMVVYRIVEGMGGNVLVSSKLKSGTTVVISLPLLN